MSNKLLQINLGFNVSTAELSKEFETAANHIAGVPGLKWKVFCMNEERGEAAGIYLFEDEASLKAYIEGPIIARMKTIEAFSNITGEGREGSGRNMRQGGPQGTLMKIITLGALGPDLNIDI